MNDKSRKEIQLEAKYYKNKYIYWLNKSLIVFFLIIIDYLIYPDRWWVHWVVLIFVIIACYHWLRKMIRTKVFNHEWEKNYINKRINNHDQTN